MITIDQMIQREVLCCISSLVSTLATCQTGWNGETKNELAELCEQASELVAPVLDYEEAVLQAGYKIEIIGAGDWQASKNGQVHGGFDSTEAVARYICEEAENIDPYEWEVYEHWAVSTWLAEKLIAQGERVDTDFASLNIWARTTTGQAIAMDGCIQRIYADMTAPLDSVAPGA